MTSNRKHVAIYVRVSSCQQNHRSQMPDLEQWAANQDEPVVWYTDKKTGKSMNRPGWKKLEEAIRLGKVSTLVIWRIDRLGRTVKGLATLFDELCQRKVNLVSLKDGLDLSTPAGRLVANVMASAAQYQSEIAGENILAGQAVARAEGKTWGGSKPGKRKKVKPEQEEAIRHLHAQGKPITAIARAVGLSRPTIYDVLAQADQCELVIESARRLLEYDPTQGGLLSIAKLREVFDVSKDELDALIKKLAAERRIDLYPVDYVAGLSKADRRACYADGGTVYNALSLR
ncbi:MAG: recombinase family protein [Planctomycetes bacterium]|nr:recombinase family protein [Planctomycetota bacterium]